MSTKKRKIKKVEEEVEVIDKKELSPKELYDLNKEKRMKERNKNKKKKDDSKKKNTKSKKSGKSNLVTKIFAIVMIVLMLASCLSSVLIYMNR